MYMCALVGESLYPLEKAEIFFKAEASPNGSAVSFAAPASAAYSLLLEIAN